MISIARPVCINAVPAKTKTISGYAIAAARDEFFVKFKYWLVVGGIIILSACGIITNFKTWFGVNPIDYSYEYKKVKELKNNGIKYIFIDEVSMISEKMWNVIAHIKNRFGFVFVGFGDFKQLKPIVFT